MIMANKSVWNDIWNPEFNINQSELQWDNIFCLLGISKKSEDNTKNWRAYRSTGSHLLLIRLCISITTLAK